jgi:anti-sigma B factor antagonist
MSDSDLYEASGEEKTAAEALLAEANLSCYTRAEGRRTVLVLEGTLDIATAPRAFQAMQQFLKEHGPTLILDLSRIDFIDSKGVGCLLGGAKAARDASGGVYLPNPAMPVRKILDMCGLTQLFPSAPPTPTLEAVSGSPPLKPAEARPAARPLKHAA